MCQSADMLIVTGNLSRFESVIEQPLTHAKNMEDRLPAYYTFIRYLIASGHFREAISICCSILRDLGEDVPVDVDPDLVRADVVKTESLLAPIRNNNELENLPRLTDPIKVWMMKFMTYLMMLYISIKEELGMYVGCLMTQRSIEYGWCPESSLGLYAFGRAMIRFMKKVDEGCFW